jgi:ATP adenylyltransferase
VDRIHTPWRQAYVTSAGKLPGCVLCDALLGAGRDDSLVVHVAERAFVMMNLFPYNSGHLMVSPKRHVGRLLDAEPAELHELMTLARRLEGILGDLYKPDGMNVGLNLGRAAGAGVADHLHLHVVPRWVGDANFMSVVGETRVIPEDTREAARRLRQRFAAP